jgi:hypothetical protein
MLLYRPPFLMVDQVTVFPDHADPETYYYLVAVPELIVDRGEPAFWATAILPAAAAGAGGAPAPSGVGRVLVSFDVRLPLPADTEERVRKEIQNRWGTPARRLVPAPLQSGKASLSVARPGAAEASKEFFVYEGHAPSLVGDNQAAFAIAAEGQEAQALVAALSVGHLAAVVTYELEVPGLAPSFEARMTVHWSRVYQRFRERELTNFIVVNEEIDRTIESLAEARAIEIEVKELDPDGAKAATRALFDELKSQVIAKLFETPRPTGEVPIEERIGRGVRDVLTSILPGVGHSLRTLDERFLADAVIDLREQQVNSYRFYPQSTLAGLLERAGGVADRLVFVRSEDLPHRVEEVLIELAGTAARLGVRAVLIRVQAMAEGRDTPLADEVLTLTTAQPERKAVRFRRLGSAEPMVQYQAEMLMDPALAPGGRERWTFDWRPVIGNRIWFDPEQWLDVNQVRLEIDDPAVFEVPATVDMHVEAWLAGEAAPLLQTDIRFTRDAASHALAVVVPDGVSAVFRGHEVFRRAGEADFVRQLPAISGPVHRIMNPFGRAWTMEVRAISAWSDTVALFAEFRVWDVLRKTWLAAEHRFQKDSATFTVRLSTSLDTPRKAEARITRVGPDGRVVRGPWTDLAGPVVAITDQVQALRRIRATLVAPHFRAAGVRKAFADLEYGDLTTTLEFAADGAVVDWTHPFPDPSQPLYRVRVRARGEGGERYVGTWRESGADDLAVSLPDAPWSESE